MDEGIIGLYDEVKMKKAMHDYDIEEALENGKEQGISIGEAKGALEKAKETARNMLNKKFSIEIISELTGLSQKDIKTLEKEI